MATTLINPTLATKASTTGPLIGQDIDQSSTGIQITTTGLISNNKNYIAVEEIDKKIIINITISATVLIVSLIAVLISALAVCTCKKGSMKNTNPRLRSSVQFHHVPSTMTPLLSITPTPVMRKVMEMLCNNYFVNIYARDLQLYTLCSYTCYNSS